MSFWPTESMMAYRGRAGYGDGAEHSYPWMREGWTESAMSTDEARAWLRKAVREVAEANKDALTAMSR